MKDLLLGILVWSSIIVLSIFIEKHNKKIESEKKIKVPYKFKATRKQRIFNIYFKKFCKKCWKFSKPIIIFILKLLGWLILLALIFVITSYNEEPSFWIVLTAYFAIIVNYLGGKDTYKKWEELAKDDEFYKIFCEQWQPQIISYVIMYSIGLKSSDTFCFLICIAAPYLMDLWNRRFITTNIKQDMILKKLTLNQ